MAKLPFRKKIYAVPTTVNPSFFSCTVPLLLDFNQIKEKMRKNYWKALTLAAMLLGAGCSEEDTPTATPPPDAGVGDSTTVVSDTSDAVKETLLLNFRADGWYDDDNEALEHHYVLISDQKGEVLALEKYQIGDQRAITIPGAFTDEKIQVTVLHHGTYTGESSVMEGIAAISFLDIDRGADWHIYPEPVYNEPMPVGYASLALNSAENTSFNGRLNVLGGNKFINNGKGNDITQVPIYQTPTPLMVSVYTDGETYVSKIDDIKVDGNYTVDIETMQKMTEKSLSISSEDYDNIFVNVTTAFVEQDNFDIDKTLEIGYGFNRVSKTTLEYPGNLFPAYESHYELDKNNFSSSIKLKGEIPDAFPLSSISATFGNTSAEDFEMEVQGDFNAFNAEWEKETQAMEVYWTVVGSSRSTSYRLPLLPDSLSLNIEGTRCKGVGLVQYSHISNYEELLQRLHKDYRRLGEKSTREESIWYSFDKLENARSRSRKSTTSFFPKR